MPLNTHFDDLSALLGRLQVPISPSEAHGLLCGLLCGQPSAGAKGVWLGELLEAAALDPATLSDRKDDILKLDAWFSEVLEAMHDTDLGFHLMMPDDSAALPERMRALGDFCAGFCYGVGLAVAGRANVKLPEDTSEIISDFNEIDSSATSDANSADEETLTELTEYVRVGVLLIIEELQPVLAIDKNVH